MAKRKYVIRVAWFKVPHGAMGIPTVDRSLSFERSTGLLLEQLRYSGIVTVHRDDERVVLFDIHPPAGVTDTAEWASHKSERMRSFQINAVAAPAWLGTEPRPTPPGE